MWDTGTFRYAQCSLRAANAILLVFDLTKPTSLDHVEDIISSKELTQEDTAIKVLVGNKTDCVKQVQPVPYRRRP